MDKIGISGKIAKAFIRSKLTPLIVLSSLLLGAFAVFVTPREEEPQIIVPVVDVIVTYPGASAKEMEQQVTEPLERLLYEISGVEYVYSITKPGMTLVIVRFYVGENVETSLVKLNSKLISNVDRIPPGVSQPMVIPRSIDDVPIMSLTLSSEKYSRFELRRIAQDIKNELKKERDISEVKIIGGQNKQVEVTLNPEKLNAYNLSPISVMNALKGANAKFPSGTFQKDNKEILVETGSFLASVRDVENVVVGITEGKVVFLKDIAVIRYGHKEASNYVYMGYGTSSYGSKDKDDKSKNPKTGMYEAVTISIAKKKGTNATNTTHLVEKQIEAFRGWIIPRDLDITVTRDYGESAKEKSNELLDHLIIATVSVIILIAFSLGFKESIVVAVAVPVTLALTLLINYLNGYTLNRVTLFALIFSIGILVDDAIVVVENIHRHFKLKGASIKSAVEAVDEVGNPTILATIAVIAALLPLAFVSGLMGPYMRPIPVGASAAMVFSLLIAFIVTPWMSYIILKNVKKDESGHKEGDDTMGRLYKLLVTPLLNHRLVRLFSIASIFVLLFASMVMVPLKMVTVKMLPFDNKNEIQVVIDMPEGTPLEKTLKATRQMAEYIRTIPEVKDLQLYVGTSAPFNFNGLVRHYFLRTMPYMSDIQVNLVDKSLRSAQSHDVAKRMRAKLQEIGKGYGANVKMAEIPPGPPVMSTLVAEVYGPTFEKQLEIARKIEERFLKTDGVVDVDLLVEEDQDKYVFEVDTVKAAKSGISAEAVAATLRIALSGAQAGLAHKLSERSPVEIFLRTPVAERSSVNAIMGINVPNQSGRFVPLGELVKVKKTYEDKTIYHKNLRPVVYVTADVAGREESPVYAILKMQDELSKLKAPEGYDIKQYYTKPPEYDSQLAMKWDGEWQITYEVFFDMGVAFAAVLVIIYVLVVGWFKNFLTPVIIMIPIPLTLVGILPGHWMLGAFFTATSMIGFIALSGIIVRNSILLVDFTIVEWGSSGNLRDAVVKAGAVRFMPIALTAAAVLVGSAVMLFDPIFQGLAISMMFGCVAATILTLIVIPLLYYEVYRNKTCPLSKEECEAKKEDIVRYQF